MGIRGTRVVSAAPRTPSPLSARAHRITALGEVSVRFLAGPDEVVAIVLVGEIATVQVQRDVLVDPVLDRRIEIPLRRLVLFQALDAADIILRRSLRAVVVRRADLQAVVLVPQDEIPRLGRVVLERNRGPGQIPLSRVARRVREVKFRAGKAQQPRKEAKSLAVVELRALDAVTVALYRLADREEAMAHDPILVWQIAVLHVAVLDEAFHVDAEQLEADHTDRVDVILKRGAVIGGGPWVQIRIAVR